MIFTGRVTTVLVKSSQQGGFQDVASLPHPEGHGAPRKDATSFEISKATFIVVLVFWHEAPLGNGRNLGFVEFPYANKTYLGICIIAYKNLSAHHTGSGKLGRS